MASRLPTISTEFNGSVRTILTKIEKKSRSEMEIANLDRLKKRIALLKREGGDHALIYQAAPVFIDYSEKILEKDQEKREAFFMSLDVRAEYLAKNVEVSKTDEYIFSLIDSIREHYRKSSSLEKAEVYKIVRAMLDNSIEYRLIAVSSK